MKRTTATSHLPRTGYLRVMTHRSDRGASLVEYALLVTLIAMVCLIAVMFLGDETSRSFSSTADSISNAN